MTTIEEAAEKLSICERDIALFHIGAKWQQERSYSEEEVLDLLKALQICKSIHNERINIEEWFKQFKNK